MGESLKENILISKIGATVKNDNNFFPNKKTCYNILVII